MYDELVKRLRSVKDSWQAEEESWMLQAADAIEELSTVVRVQKAVLEKFPRWIPVTERLPERGERVLCYCRANIYEVMKMRTDGDWVYDTNHVYMHSFVTHWMPLPEPPKEE